MGVSLTTSGLRLDGFVQAYPFRYQFKSTIIIIIISNTISPKAFEIMYTSLLFSFPRDMTLHIFTDAFGVVLLSFLQNLYVVLFVFLHSNSIVNIN